MMSVMMNQRSLLETELDPWEVRRDAQLEENEAICNALESLGCSPEMILNGLEIGSCDLVLTWEVKLKQQAVEFQQKRVY